MNFIEVIDRTAMGCLLVTLHALFALLIWLIFRGGAEDRQQVRGWWLALLLNAVGALVLALRWEGDRLNFTLYVLASSLVVVSILQRAVALANPMLRPKLNVGLWCAFVLHTSFAFFLGWLGVEPAAGIAVIHMLQAGAALLLIFVALQPRQTGNSDGVRMIFSWHISAWLIRLRKPSLSGRETMTKTPVSLRSGARITTGCRTRITAEC